jgi:hypothetical protein
MGMRVVAVVAPNDKVRKKMNIFNDKNFFFIY